MLKTLGEQQTAGRATLGEADTQPEQISATQGLANAFDVAGDDLEAIKAPAADAARHTRLVDLVNQAQDQYGAMAADAEAGDVAGFATGAGNVGRTEAELEKQIDALRGAASQ